MLLKTAWYEGMYAWTCNYFVTYEVWLLSLESPTGKFVTLFGDFKNWFMRCFTVLMKLTVVMGWCIDFSLLISFAPFLTPAYVVWQEVGLMSFLGGTPSSSHNTSIDPMSFFGRGYPNNWSQIPSQVVLQSQVGGTRVPGGCPRHGQDGVPPRIGYVCLVRLCSRR